MTATDSVPFTTIVQAVVSRLVAGTGVDKNKVRVVVAPDAGLPEYLANPGLLVQVLPPEPDAMAGAGRRAYLAQRVIRVWVVTGSLADPGGRAETTTYGHLAAEEAVCNSLTLDPPVGDPGFSILPVKTIKWIPGGQQLVQAVKTNPRLSVSVFPFAITYIPPLTC